MLLGLLSDTHNNLRRTEEALSRLREAEVDRIIHCGDLGGEEVLTQLFTVRECGTPVEVVLGNVDEWDSELLLFAKKLGMELPRLIRAEADGVCYGITHGHDPKAWQELSEDPRVQLLFSGHTHVARDAQEGHQRHINPGAVHRSAQPQCATLHLGSGILQPMFLQP